MNNNFIELKQREYAIDYLANHLIEGTITLFLGAGASKGFRLPSWVELCNKFREKYGLSDIPVTSPTESIQLAIDEALDKIDHDELKKIEIIKELLYPTSFSIKNAYESHLLIALSSLLIGRKRGHVNKVVTYNYDSMLEWFLSLFGFEVNTIRELPALEGSEDVRIYHPHGYIPHDSLNMEGSNFAIFGMTDANRRLKPDNIWFQKIRQIMSTSICLFVGLSGNSLTDRSMAPLFNEIGDLVKDDRPLGIWIYMDTLTEPKDKEFLRNNIIALEINDPDEICNFILEISQKALEKSLCLKK